MGPRSDRLAALGLLPSGGFGSRDRRTRTRYGLANHGGRIISVVDDDVSLRRSLRNLLSSVGFEVETFESAEAFLASDSRERAACLVLDLRMPGMGGLDLLSHLAATGSRIPVIVLTAHGDDDARRRALDAGAVAFLIKPFQSAALLDAIQRVV
ncbi:MAG TPA: response regulator [Methylomirabilota bacterium]